MSATAVYFAVVCHTAILGIPQPCIKIDYAYHDKATCTSEIEEAKRVAPDNWKKGASASCLTAAEIESLRWRKMNESAAGAGFAPGGFGTEGDYFIKVCSQAGCWIGQHFDYLEQCRTMRDAGALTGLSYECVEAPSFKPVR